MKKTKIMISVGVSLCFAAGISATVWTANHPLSLQDQLVEDNIEALAENEGLPVDVLLKYCHWAPEQQCDIDYNGYTWGCSNMARN